MCFLYNYRGRIGFDLIWVVLKTPFRGFPKEESHLICWFVKAHLEHFLRAESCLVVGLVKVIFEIFTKGKMLPCLSLVDLHSFVQCLPLPHLQHNPKGRGILFGFFLAKILFLQMPCLQSLFMWPGIPQLKHLTFGLVLVPLEISSLLNYHHYHRDQH